MAKVTDKREALVKRVIKQSWGYVVGGHENDHMDNGTPMPDREALVMATYYEVMDTDKVQVGNGYVPVEKDIRFLGKDRIMELIEERADKDGY